MKKILLCQDIHESGRHLLKTAFRITVAPNHKEETIRSLIADFDAVIVRTGTKLTREIIEAGKKLVVIGRSGAGVDNVDIESATKRGIPICYAPESNFVSVAEHTLSLILALAKQLPLMDKSVRDDNFDIRYKCLPVDLIGKTIGIVGLGRIGREVEKKCIEGFGMRVIRYDPYIKDVKTTPVLRRLEDLTKLFEESDFVTIHVPHNKETHHMIERSLIRRMKRTSFLINTSRGAVVDESALSEALAEKKIAGAGLDVFEKEPPEPDNKLLELPNVLLTPHSATLTKECVERMALDTVQGILDFFDGKRPKYVFNPEVFKKDR